MTKRGIFYKIGMLMLIFAIVSINGCVEEEKNKEINEDNRYTYQDYLNTSIWGSVSDTESPILTPHQYMNISFNTIEHHMISISDDKYLGVSSLSLSDVEDKEGGFPCQLFNWNISQDQIHEISIKWEGHGRYFTGEKVGVTLYIWNLNQSTWISIGNSNYENGDQIITQTFDNDLNSIIDNGSIYVLACSGSGWGRSTSVIVTDYVEISIPI